ncbi:MAG: hypothetical protein ACUVSP_10340, partial [Desulfotomaculales bacterium]
MPAGLTFPSRSWPTRIIARAYWVKAAASEGNWQSFWGQKQVFAVDRNRYHPVLLHNDLIETLLCRSERKGVGKIVVIVEIQVFFDSLRINQVSLEPFFLAQPV